MKQKEKVTFLEYLDNTHDELFDDVRKLQQRVRYRDIDAVDCLELQLALERLNAFDEFARNSKAILRLTPYDTSVYAPTDKARIVHKRGDNKNGL